MKTVKYSVKMYLSYFAVDTKIDSTPLEASRYDENADYHPHYGCKMDKAHITMVGTLPVFMTHTRGLAGDPQELIKHIEALKKMDAKYPPRNNLSTFLHCT